MSSSEALGSLRTPIKDTFTRLDDQQKRDRLATSSVAIITPRGAEEEYIRNVFTQAESLGFTPVRLQEVLESIAFAMQQEQIVLPADVKDKQGRAKIIEELLKKLKFVVGEDGKLQILLRTPEGLDINLVAESANNRDALTNSVQALAADSLVFGKVVEQLRHFAKEHPGIAVEQSNPNQIPIEGARITLTPQEGEVAPNVLKRSDHVLETRNGEAIRFGVLRETLRQEMYGARREELQQALANREIIALPKFRQGSKERDK